MHPRGCMNDIRERSDDRRQNKQFEAVHSAFEKGQWGGIVHEGSASLAGGSVFRVSTT